MHIMFVGGVGQGKSFCATAFAHKSPEEFKHVYTNMPLQKMPGREIKQWRDFNEVGEATCGILLIDEADMWLNSREFAKLDNTARDLIKEHRKHHLRVVTTSQHVKFVDKVFRILCDEVRVVKKLSLPLIGAIWPDCLRPSIMCPHCKVIRHDDGEGDDAKWWKRWLFFGTVYVWRVYPPEVLGEEENANAERAEEAEESKSIGWGYCFYSQEIADMYSTSHRQSTAAQQRRKSFTWGSKKKAAG